MMTFQSRHVIYLYVQSHYLYLILCLDCHLSHMTPEQTYQTLPQHLPNNALDGVVEKKTSFFGKIKKVDQKREVFADVLNLLKAAFRDSYLCMQTQVLQHYPPSSVFLASINMKIPKVFFYTTNMKIILSLMLELSQSVITTICI